MEARKLPDMEFKTMVKMMLKKVSKKFKRMKKN